VVCWVADAESGSVLRSLMACELVMAFSGIGRYVFSEGSSSF